MKSDDFIANGDCGRLRASNDSTVYIQMDATAA